MEKNCECKYCEKSVDVDVWYLCGRSFFRLPDDWMLDTSGDKVCPECLSNMRAMDNESR
jgi:hypothetical protein